MKGQFRPEVLTDFNSRGDLRPIKKSSSVQPNARDKKEHHHTSGPKDFKIMTEANAEQQFVKSSRG